MVIDWKNRRIAAILMIIVICMPLMSGIAHIVFYDGISNIVAAELLNAIYMIFFNTLIYIWIIIDMFAGPRSPMVAVPFIINGGIAIIGVFLGVFRRVITGDNFPVVVSFDVLMFLSANVVGAVSAFISYDYRKKLKQCTSRQFFLVVELFGVTALISIISALRYLLMADWFFTSMYMTEAFTEILRFLAVLFVFKAIRNELTHIKSSANSNPTMQAIGFYDPTTGLHVDGFGYPSVPMNK